VGHEARGDVVPMESLPEFSPQDLVTVTKSDGVVHPPSGSGPMKLSGHVPSLLLLCAV
jgi:hypothetical protein